MYATVDEIKASSKRVPAILTASPVELNLWMEEAANEINVFCSQDFLFEPQATKSVQVDDSLVILPKTLSGKVNVIVEGGDSVPSDDLEHVAGEYMLRYRPLNVVNWSHYTSTPTTLLVTGDWGYPTSQEEILVSYANEIKTKYNTHRIDTEVHNVADTVNIVTAADATDLDSAITLLNDVKVEMNAHFADIVVHVVADAESISTASATDLTSALALANAIEAAWGEHIDNTESHTATPSDSDNTTLSLDNPIMPFGIKKVFIALVKRIAIREDEEDIYNRNSGYVSETTGDGFEYSLEDGTLRAMIQPEDFKHLWPHVNEGRVVM